MERWAQERADFRNAHHMYQNSTPWLADDFLGRGNYRARVRQSAKDKLDVVYENARLAQMKPGGVPDDVPDAFLDPQQLAERRAKAN